MKYGRGNHHHQQLTDHILGEIVVQGQGNRIWQKIRIDVKPVLSRSEWFHKFHSTYARRCIRRAGESITQMQWRRHHMTARGF